MTMQTTLTMIFKDPKAKSKSLSIVDPKEFAKKADIEDCMQDIIADKVFVTANGALTEADGIKRKVYGDWEDKVEPGV